MACGCGHSDCGCETVKGRRGPRGLQGAPGAAGQNAQLLSGSGVPLSAPPVTTAPAQYMDTAEGGHYWIWSISGQIWTDTGVQVQGDDGANGINAFTALAAPFTIPIAGGVSVATVQSTAWMAVGIVVGVQEAGGGGLVGYYLVTTILDGTNAVLTNLRNDAELGYQNNLTTGTVASGKLVTAAGVQGPPGIPPMIMSGSGAPGVAPASNTAIYLQNGGTYWTWNVGGPWVNTGISVTGPPGPQGNPGTNGYSPQTSSGSGVPSGGSNGDIYFQQVNGGQVRVWYKSGGIWVTGPTVTSNRLLGFSNSNPTPNPGSLPANSGDQWWTQIGTFVTMWVYNGSTWVTALSFSTSGGGGTGDLPTVISNTTGQLSGFLPVHWQRTNYRMARLWTTTTNGGTITFNTDVEYHDLSILHETTFLNYTDPPLDEYSEWVFMLTNNMASTQAGIEYSADQWKVPGDVVVPEVLNPGESCILHCYFYGRYMWISKVDQNPTIL